MLTPGTRSQKQAIRWTVSSAIAPSVGINMVTDLSIFVFLTTALKMAAAPANILLNPAVISDRPTIEATEFDGGAIRRPANN